MSNNKAVFWKRIFAFFIDYLIIGIFGIILCIVFFEQIARLGNWAIFIGLIIFVSYFGILNSHISKGQTLGKKIFNIKVINKDGEYLTLKKSLLRALILSPILFGSLILPMSIFQLIFPKLISCFLLLNILLLIINTPSRQVIHDMFIKSFVVENSFEQSIQNNINWKKITIAFCLLIILNIFTVANFKNFIIQNLPVAEVVNSNVDNKFKNNLINIIHNVHIANGTKETTLIVVLYANPLLSGSNNINIPDEDITIYANNIINAISGADKYDYLSINFALIANIGIADFKKDNPVTHSIKEWKEKQLSTNNSNN